MYEQRVEEIATLRILLLGDPGVGKTSLSNLLASEISESAQQSTGSDWWTVKVGLHECPCNKYKPPTPKFPTPPWTSSSSNSSNMSTCNDTCDNLYFIELYELTSNALRCPEKRRLLYRSVDGIILIYNMMDMTSHDNLHDWLNEPLRYSKKPRLCGHRRRELSRSRDLSHVPMLVVGTRVDLLTSRRLRRAGGIADQCEAEELFLNCLDASSMAPDSRNFAKVRRFYNKVIDYKATLKSRCY
ncbi:rab-like protein 3 [Scaptodrosophila lebanonensis]|uniref:Rab-like protein 3 n=1 Tax=Drosophila lebanonensis TaxID=7225 RepID=A0A6J2UAT2_DROLE|nr:rab-like protein 3 [Scaptodrosophila lebanonensis]